MKRGIYTVLLLVLANVFMTLAWYWHLKYKDVPWFSKLSIFAIIGISWGIAFFEYSVQVPANKIGFEGNGGPFTIWQLKILQEAISIIVFTVFTLLAFKNEVLKTNHIIGFGFLFLAVYFIFKK